MDNTMTERNPQAPHTEARSILTSVVETQLLPPERFKGDQQGEVTDIAKIGECVATLRKIKDHYEAEFYPSSGKSVKLSLDPTSHDIAHLTSDSIRMKSQHQYGQRPVDLFNQLGFLNNG